MPNMREVPPIPLARDPGRHLLPASCCPAGSLLGPGSLRRGGHSSRPSDSAEVSSAAQARSSPGLRAPREHSPVPGEGSSWPASSRSWARAGASLRMDPAAGLALPGPRVLGSTKPPRETACVVRGLKGRTVSAVQSSHRCHLFFL